MRRNLRYGGKTRPKLHYDMFRVYVLVVVVIASMAAACSVDRSHSLVDRDVLVNVLVELHLAQARSSLVSESRPPASDSILEFYGIENEQFRETMRHYAHRPDEYVALMDTVIDRMRLLRPDLADDPGGPIQSYRYQSMLPDTLAPPNRGLSD